MSCIMAIFTLCSIAVSAQQIERTDSYSPTQITFLINGTNPTKGGRLWVIDTADSKFKIAEKVSAISNAYADEIDRQAWLIDSLQALVYKYKTSDSAILTVTKERDQNYSLVIKLQESNDKLIRDNMALNAQLKKCGNGIELKFDTPRYKEIPKTVYQLTEGSVNNAKITDGTITPPTKIHSKN